MTFHSCVIFLGFSILVPSMAASADCGGTVTPQMCAWVENGKLGDLRRPDFANRRLAVRGFYNEFNYGLAWFMENQLTPQARALIQILQDADNQGLPAADYDGPRWRGRIASLRRSRSSSSPPDFARFDLALTVSLIRYAADFSCGRINPERAVFGANGKCGPSKLARFARRLAHAQDVRRIFGELEPSHAAYQSTKAVLQRYLLLAQEKESPLVPVVEPVHPGDSYPSLDALAERLRQLGDFPPTATLPEWKDHYDGALVKAVQHFQVRHGLFPDGAIDGATFTELITPLHQRIIQLRLALEQWRWLASGGPGQFIVVNIPEFQLRAFDRGSPSLSMKVIVGQSSSDEPSGDHKTPLLNGFLEYLLFRPYWTVPSKIIWAEIIPAAQADQTFFTNQDYELVDSQGFAVAVTVFDPVVLRKIRDGKLEVRQKPGPENSLGLIKFVFPNPYGVYIHGTPDKELFGYSRRDFSHGCIRVENPIGLAEWVLREDSFWTSDRIQAAVKGPVSGKATGAPQRTSRPLLVSLRKPIPFFTVYQTAVVKGGDEVYFFEDIYNLNAKLDAKLVNSYQHPHQ